MDTPGLQYEILVERALRGVLKEALRQVVDTGLPGEHHFYITFRTTHPDVTLAPRLRALYPEEMTIVLQHQYWNLEVQDDFFAVELSFQSKMERLVIPFEAVTGFADPHAQFGLQFQGSLSGDVDLYDDDDFDSEDDSPESQPGTGTDALSAKGSSPDAGEGDNKVVTLDAFRRK